MGPKEWKQKDCEKKTNNCEWRFMVIIVYEVEECVKGEMLDVSDNFQWDNNTQELISSKETLRSFWFVLCLQKGVSLYYSKYVVSTLFYNTSGKRAVPQQYFLLSCHSYWNEVKAWPNLNYVIISVDFAIGLSVHSLYYACRSNFSCWCLQFHDHLVEILLSWFCIWIQK